MTLDTALQEMRTMTSVEDQRDALSGYLAGPTVREIIVKQLGSPLMAFAKQIDLPAYRWRAALSCAAAAGSGEAALEAASAIAAKSKTDRADLETAVVHAWALSDPASLSRSFEMPDEAGRRDLLARQFGTAIPWLSVTAVLNPDKPLTTGLLTFAPRMHWPFRALEAREETFRFFEGHAKEPGYEDAIERFADAAARYAPERAAALQRLAAGPGPREQ
jgi:hypothetical protein